MYLAATVREHGLNRNCFLQGYKGANWQGEQPYTSSPESN